MAADRIARRADDRASKLGDQTYFGRWKAILERRLAAVKGLLGGSGHRDPSYREDDDSSPIPTATISLFIRAASPTTWAPVCEANRGAMSSRSSASLLFSEVRNMVAFVDQLRQIAAS